VCTLCQNNRAAHSFASPPMHRVLRVAALGACAGLGYWCAVAGLALAGRGHPTGTIGWHSAAGFALAGGGAWACVAGWCGAVSQVLTSDVDPLTHVDGDPPASAHKAE
jgi:hypothetical protein